MKGQYAIKNYVYICVCKLSYYHFFPGELQDEKHYSYLREAETAYINGASSLDISTEREKLTRASLVIFQFPLQWFSVPAILKGWFDRILVPGYAFKIPDVYDNGFMKVS